ncbi:MAG: hypothetical protein HZA19_03125 [Nitrospirae bacterium]|nr:hypothetical protein [Nitrospirota bacterium]
MAIQKEQIFLEITADMVKFYTFIAHSMRILTEETPSGQISLKDVQDQLRNIRTVLVPRLEKNPVVMKKVETDYQKAVALIDALQKTASPADRGRLAADANAVRSYAQEKSGSLSDLVAIFRSL